MNINATLLGQTLAFVLFVAICWRYVWPPIIAIMEEREKRISDDIPANIGARYPAVILP